MRDRSVVIWLVIVYLFICAMVLIGGTTRLTGSGLSMVEWHPLMGALPPMTEEGWLAVFGKYQETPQFKLVNQWMTLADFKQIFFWEYFHRLVGRLIGVIFFVPWVVFVVRRQIRGQLAKRTALAFVLGGAQGLLGWFMVKSGLIDMPAVSHFRLAAHLMLALFLGCWILWIILDLRPGGEESGPVSKRLRRLSWGLFALIALQCVYGAFMAGTRAGYMYSTFPTMNGEWVPSGFADMNPLSHPISIHFLHRVLAWLTAAAVLGFGFYARSKATTRRQRTATYLLLLAVVLQFLLGTFTVLFNMPIPLAVAHQGGGILLLSAALFGAHAWSGSGSAKG